MFCLWVGIEVSPSAQHLTSGYRRLMWDMKKGYRSLVPVKNLDDHYSSVLSAPNVNLMHKTRASCDITERNTNLVSNVRIQIAVTNGPRVVDPSTESTLGRSMD